MGRSKSSSKQIRFMGAGSDALRRSHFSLSQCRLRLSRPLRKGEATAIRGFFGRQFADQVHMHNHDADGSPIYLYPRVQYKVIDQTALLFGINEGSELLQKLWLDFDQSIPLADHDQSLTVLETQFETSSYEIRHSVNPIEYKFATPWLALNQKNFGEYTRTRNQKIRREKLESTIVGNCLGHVQVTRHSPLSRARANHGRLQRPNQHQNQPQRQRHDRLCRQVHPHPRTARLHRTG